MKFTRNFIKYLALYFIILLSIQNAYTLALTTKTQNKSLTKRLNNNNNSKNGNSSKLKTNTEKNKIPILSSLYTFTCSFFRCSKVDKESTKKILNESVNLKDALVAKIISEKKYFEKNLKDFSLMKISTFLGVLPPHLLQEPYASVIQQHVYCFLENEIADEKKKLTEKMVKAFRKVIILRKFLKKLKTRISLAKQNKEKQNVSKLASKLAYSSDINKVQNKLVLAENDAQDPQNKPLINLLGRISLVLPNEKSDKIPAETKILSFTKANDEFIEAAKAQYITQFSECKSDALEKYLLKFTAENKSYENGALSDKPDLEKNKEILQELKDEFSFIKTGVRASGAKKRTSKHRKNNEVIEYTSDAEALKSTSKERLLAISQTLDMISDNSKKIKDISQKAADTLKNLKETAKMIKAGKDFLKDSELKKDFEVVKTVINKLDTWKLTKDENLEKIQKVLGKYEKRINPIVKASGSIYKFTKTTSEIVKGIRSLSLEDRPSIIISKTLILAANVASIVPGLNSHKFAIEFAKYSGESIRDSEKLQKIIDKSIIESAKEFEYTLSRGYLPFHVIISSDFAIDSDLLDKYTTEDFKNEVSQIANSIGESAKNIIEPMVNEIKRDVSEGRIDKYTVMAGDDFAMDVVSFERVSETYEKGIMSNFSNWFSSGNSSSDSNSSSNDSYGSDNDSDSGSKDSSSSGSGSESNSGGDSKSNSDSDSDKWTKEAQWDFNDRAGNNPFERKKK